MSAYIKLKNPSQLDNIISKFKEDYDDFLDNRDVIEALEKKIILISYIIYGINIVY